MLDECNVTRTVYVVGVYSKTCTLSNVRDEAETCFYCTMPASGMLFQHAIDKSHEHTNVVR